MKGSRKLLKCSIPQDINQELKASLDAWRFHS